MSNVLRTNRKGRDSEIVRLNSIGLSLQTIASKIQCHPTAITLRLKSLNVPAADTRRAFMEDILSSLPNTFQDELANVLYSEDFAQVKSVKEYVRALLIKDVSERTGITYTDPVPTMVISNSTETVLVNPQDESNGADPIHG